MWRLASAFRGNKDFGRHLKSTGRQNSLCHSQARTSPKNKAAGTMGGPLEIEGNECGGYPQWRRQKTNISLQMPAESLGYY